MGFKEINYKLTNMNKIITIIEDDIKLNNGIKIALEKEEYTFQQFQCIAAARAYLKENRTDLILLDVNLPDGNGIDFLCEIRKFTETPLILITVDNMELDIVTGLEAGANDYITKPFSLMVLRARVAVQLRNVQKTNVFVQDDFVFDFDRMKFSKDGEDIELSRTEQKILRFLCENRGATLKRSYLIDNVWTGDTEYVDEHALTVAVKRLRDKLEDNSKNPQYIKTVYGIGYTWEKLSW